jgi:hypothetical protein
MAGYLEHFKECYADYGDQRRKEVGDRGGEGGREGGTGRGFRWHGLSQAVAFENAWGSLLTSLPPSPPSSAPLFLPPCLPP